MDDDGIEYEQQIVDKFYIQQQARSDQIALNYVENLEFSTGIIADCNKIVYDSTRREIFVEERLWDSASSYYLIKIIDAKAEKSFSAFKKKEPFEKTFLTKLDTCTYCQVWDMTVKRKAYKNKSPG
jgi:hypothetical protein